MAAKAKEKVVRIRFEGREYTSRWSTFAFRDFLKRYKELVNGGETGAISSGIDLMDIAIEVLNGMLLRANLSQEGIDAVDADVYTNEAKKVLNWYTESITNMNTKMGDEKNEETVGEVS